MSVSVHATNCKNISFFVNGIAQMGVFVVQRYAVHYFPGINKAVRSAHGGGVFHPHICENDSSGYQGLFYVVSPTHVRTHFEASLVFK